VTDSADLIQLLLDRSVRQGDFVLASGARSSFYIDARLTTMSSQGLALIGRLGLRAIRQAGWAPKAVGGLTMVSGKRQKSTEPEGELRGISGAATA
jgi:orotate phosphoribosyltransferase